MHDPELLDALEALDPEPFEGSVWRVKRDTLDPLGGYPSGGRWDPGRFEVIYASLDPNGAQAEVLYHLERAPVFPSRARYFLHELAVETRRTLRLADFRQLESLGVDRSKYDRPDYETTQAIGAAAHFLEFDGLIVPSARWNCNNLILFMEQREPDLELRVVRSDPVDWANWRKRNRSKMR